MTTNGLRSFGVGSTTDTESLRVELPAIIHSYGATGSGRHHFLLNLAQQTIQAGAGLVFVDSLADSSTWIKLFSIASEAGRSDECFAKTSRNEGLWDIPVQRVVNTGSILWYGHSALENSLNDVCAELDRFLADLAKAVTDSSQQDRPPLVVILDGTQDIFNGMPQALLPLVSTVSNSVTLVFSDCRVENLDTSQVGTAACFIMGRAEGSEDAQVMQELCGGDIDFEALNSGEAVICLGDETGVKLAHRVRLPYSDISLVQYVQPANSRNRVSVFRD